MKINIFQITISNSERLCTECKEATRKPVYVRGHFRMVKGKKVYVRAHYRNTYIPASIHNEAMLSGAWTSIAQ